MAQNQPLVTIGIPTYNRVAQLKRSIETALNQNYSNIEVVVSDNASTDETQKYCELYCNREDRLKYMRQVKNIGPTANFSAVLMAASGEYFMWLGDDDWIDTDYVSSCARLLTSDTHIALVSGVPRYYANDKHTHTGKYFSLLSGSPWRRVISYYAQVADNGMFYGLMRTAQLRHLKIKNTMGGDWLMIAGVAFTGKVRVLPEISVHRETGGATANYRKIREILGLSGFVSKFPKLSIAINVWKDVAVDNSLYSSQNRLPRVAAANLIFLILVGKTILHHMKAAPSRIFTSTRNCIGRLSRAAEKHAAGGVNPGEPASGNKQDRLQKQPEREQ